MAAGSVMVLFMLRTDENTLKCLINTLEKLSWINFIMIYDFR